MFFSPVNTSNEHKSNSFSMIQQMFLKLNILFLDEKTTTYKCVSADNSLNISGYECSFFHLKNVCFIKQMFTGLNYYF